VLNSVIAKAKGCSSFGPFCVVRLHSYTLIKRAPDDMQGQHAVVLTELEVMCGPVELIGLPKCVSTLHKAQEDARLVPQEETQQFNCANCANPIVATLAPLRVNEAYAFKVADGLCPVGEVQAEYNQFGSASFIKVACANCSQVLGKFYRAAETPELRDIILVDQAALRPTDAIVPVIAPQTPHELANLVEMTSALKSSQELLADPIKEFEERLSRLESTVAWLVKCYQQEHPCQ
jgi:hypothetical protein